MGYQQKCANYVLTFCLFEDNSMRPGSIKYSCKKVCFFLSLKLLVNFYLSMYANGVQVHLKMFPLKFVVKLGSQIHVKQC